MYLCLTYYVCISESHQSFQFQDFLDYAISQLHYLNDIDEAYPPARCMRTECHLVLQYSSTSASLLQLQT